MIAFDGPEGKSLRAMTLSRSALSSIWFAAVDQGCSDWIAWAHTELTKHIAGADLAAMNFVQAASDGELRRAQQLWSILGTFPSGGAESRFLRAARDLRASLPF